VNDELIKNACMDFIVVPDLLMCGTCLPQNDAPALFTRLVMRIGASSPDPTRDPRFLSMHLQ
jgi:hypothetical protein